MLLEFLSIQQKAGAFSLLYTPTAHFYLSVIIGCIGLIFLAALPFSKTLSNVIVEEIKLIEASIRMMWNRFFTLPTGVQLGFGIWYALLLGGLLWAAAHQPLHPDEEASLAYFVSKGPLVILSYYPGPNNHIAYNLMAWVWYSLGVESVITMRLPALLMCAFTIPLVWLWLYRKAGTTTAFLGTSSVMLYPHVWYYCALGRGYGPMWCLWVVLALLLSAPMHSRLNYRPLCIAISIMGAWMVPSFLPSAASVWLSAFVRDVLSTHLRKAVSLYWPVGIWVGLGCALLYMPVFLFQGIQALWSHGWAETYHQLYLHNPLSGYVKELMCYYAGNEHYGTVALYLSLLMGSLICTAFFKPTYKLYVGMLVLNMQLYPWVMIVILESMPPERIFLSSGALLYGCIGLSIGYAVDRFVAKKTAP